MSVPEATTPDDSSIQTLETPNPFSGFKPDARLCFYPSCGYEMLWAVMDLNAEQFVFSDKERRHSNWDRIAKDFAKHQRPIRLIHEAPGFVQFASGNKIAVLFWEDNNLTLDRLYEHDFAVHHFVGICDGCCEGGNYECVHDRPFIQRLLRVAANGMRYSTDHSWSLQKFHPYDQGWGMFHTKKFRDRLLLSQFREPSKHYGKTWPVPLPEQIPNAFFELQGVLVRMGNAGNVSVQCTVLPKGRMEPTQLDVLRPFRTVAQRGWLAEFSVTFSAEEEENRRLAKERLLRPQARHRELERSTEILDKRVLKEFNRLKKLWR